MLGCLPVLFQGDQASSEAKAGPAAGSGLVNRGHEDLLAQRHTVTGLGVPQNVPQDVPQPP